MRFVALWKTIRAAVPEAGGKFVDGLGRRIEPVDGVTSVGQVEPRPPCECVEWAWPRDGLPRPTIRRPPEWLTRRPPHPSNGSQAMVLGWRQWVRS